MAQSNEPIEYTKNLEYLPDFMRDFHDQKEIFKTIQHLYRDNESLQKLPNGWTDNHIYVIDYFLWFMGQHGYKLQRVRKKGVQFYNLRDTIDKMLNDRGRELLKILQGNQKSKPMGNQKEFIAQVERLKKEFDFAAEMAVMINADRLKYMETIEVLTTKVNKYEKALNLIAQMSDPGDYWVAICKMKSIAADALTTKTSEDE